MTMRMGLLLTPVAGALLLAACSTKPLVQKELAMMTPAEIAAAGLECRKDRPPDTNIPRTICASKEAWASFDERRRTESDALMAEGRKYTNVGRFNRD